MKTTIVILTALMLATLGWLANDVYSTVYVDSPRFIERAASMFQGAPSRPLPVDRVGENQIEVLQDKVVLSIPNAQWATFTPTHSMAPVFDAGSNAIEIVPKSPDEIHVGDIISYVWRDGSTIIHRVVQTGHDGDGWYAIMKGDNNPFADPDKVRFEQVRRVVVAIVY